MVSAKKGVYEFRRRANLTVSGQELEIPVVDVISYLNEAQAIVFQNRVFRTQTNKKVRYDLRPVLKSKIPLSFKKVDDKCYLAEFPSDIYHPLNQYAIATKDCCDGIEKEIIIRIVQSDDLHEARQNPYRKADFFYEQLIGVEDENGLLVYHDNEMDIQNVFIDYYRHPQEVHAPDLILCNKDNGTYYDYNGSVITQNSDFELDDLFYDIIDVADLLYKKDKQKLEDYQAELRSVLQNQTLFT